MSQKNKFLVIATPVTTTDNINHTLSNTLPVSKYSDKDYYRITSPALRVEAERDLGKLTSVINDILFNPKNWIVVEKVVDAAKTVIFKPLDIASYCAPLFDKGSRVLIMSATILDHTSFCNSLGLAPQDVKFIRVNSDFPEAGRPIYSMRVHPLNYLNLQESDVRAKITKSIDEIMNLHTDHKGIIHTTSYAQNNFIVKNLSEQNAERLIQTNPYVPREEIITKHIESNEPTVLISPSLYMGIDLKDDLSRFQIITKVPYPDLSDKWVNAKIKSFDNKLEGEKWYVWQTALRIVQAYGRSIRSRNDWAITYILDSNFDWFVRKNTHLFPTWFLSAIKLKQVFTDPLRQF